MKSEFIFSPPDRTWLRRPGQVSVRRSAKDIEGADTNHFAGTGSLASPLSDEKVIDVYERPAERISVPDERSGIDRRQAMAAASPLTRLNVYATVDKAALKLKADQFPPRPAGAIIDTWV